MKYITLSLEIFFTKTYNPITIQIIIADSGGAVYYFDT